MGIGRDSRHKHYKTGGRSKTSIKKRKYEMGRPATPCKLGAKRVRRVRCRGGNMKYRALRLDAGNYAWGSVVYNATSNELVRPWAESMRNEMCKDVDRFMQWYLKKYGVDVGKKKKGAAKEEKQDSNEQNDGEGPGTWFQSGRLLACIASRPGQCGRADGYVLEGEDRSYGAWQYTSYIGSWMLGWMDQ
eukprot:Skav204204  [mRNA]  locus=scaffold985:236210:244312:- [translate_table: standard]